MISNTYHRVVLDFNLERTDKDSMKSKAVNIFKTKSFDQSFAEFWEILNLFGILKTTQNIYSNYPDTINHIIDVYQTITKTKNKYSVSNKLNIKTTLIICKYSDLNLEENASIQLLIDELPELINTQSAGTNMILQLFGIQTQTMVELIYYLSTLYNQSYLMKPLVTSNLSDSIYLVLLDFKNKININVPKHPKNSYLLSLFTDELPNTMITTIQCINSSMMLHKYKIYNEIKSYLDTKVYEGASYDEFIKRQNDNINKWFETFTDISDMKKILDQSIGISDKQCEHHTKFDNLY